LAHFDRLAYWESTWIVCISFKEIPRSSYENFPSDRYFPRRD